MRQLTFALLMVGIFSLNCSAKLSGSLATEAIEARLKPEGVVEVEGKVADAKPVQKSTGPEAIYNKNCATCHKTGLAGAPKWGIKKQWEARIAAGSETLLDNAWNGIRAMPPKGNCFDCTKQQIAETIDYILENLE